MDGTDCPETVHSQKRSPDRENKEYVFYQALNGKMAYQIAQMKKPDLIITDWVMPEMNGIELIKKEFFQDISLVGIINADSLLHLPDFRATERFFQFIMQIAQFLDSESLKAKIIIQTHNPSHYVFKKLRAYDFKGFYAHEIKTRKELSYPPFGRLINFRIEGIIFNCVRKVSKNKVYSKLLK